MHALLCGLAKFELAGGRFRGGRQESTSDIVCVLQCVIFL